MREKNQLISIVIATIGLAVGITLLTIIRDPALAAMYRTLALLDIFDETAHKSAIEYLFTKNIVEGYPDQTFRPDRTLNRAEFTTLIDKAQKVDLRQYNAQCFPDTPTDQWYHPYVCAGKERNWVQGYPDGLFRPGNETNKVEAIAILCRAQNWNIPEVPSQPFPDTPSGQWYTPCLAYAQSKNFLEESSSFNFNPSEKITRGAFAEILFRNLITLENNADTYSPTLTKNDEKKSPETTVQNNAEQKVIGIAETPKDLTQPTVNVAPQTDIAGTEGEPHPFRVYGAEFFNDIILREPLPNRFYKNETYILEGHITASSFDTAFAFLNADDEHQNFIDSNVTGNQFKIPLIFTNTGNFELGIIPGRNGTSKLAMISIVEKLPTPETNESASLTANLNINHQSDETKLSWDPGDNTVARITFEQGTERKKVFLRQNPSSYTIRYIDFANFQPGTVTVTVETARAIETAPLRLQTQFGSPTKLSFKAAEHHASDIKTDDITVDAFENVRPTQSPISLNGTAVKNLQIEAAIVKPDGFVERIDMSAGNAQGKKILAESSWSFNYTPKTNGTHLIEINNTEGEAAFNVPFYVATGVPMIPDFFDKTTAELTIGEINSKQAREEMLALIVKDRADHNLPAVRLDDNLTNLAQAHSDDMVARNFFGHYNPDGKSPDDRRRALSIQTGVGENLAKSPNIVFAQRGLMHSAIHRENILTPDWTRMGIGVTKNSQGYLLVAQEFSTDPLTESGLENLENAMLLNINQQRTNLGRTSMGMHTELNDLADRWSERMVTNDFFGFETPEGVKLLDNIRALNLPTAVQAFILEGNDVDTLSDEIALQSNILETEWTKAGIGISVTEFGILKITILYTTD